MKASVIVPTYNRKERLRGCILSLLNQNFEDYEIIVVDDGSSDGTEQMVESLQQTHSNLKYLKQKNRGPGIARNYGVENSEGDIVVFTDDDCIADEPWLKTMVNSFNGNSYLGIVGGGYVTPKEKGIIGLWQGCNVKHGIKDGRLKNPSFFEANNLAILKQAYLEVGGFCPVFGPKDGSEDFNLCYQILKSGYGSMFNDSAKIQHLHKLNLKGILKQNYIAGRGDIVFMSLNPERRRFKPHSFLLIPFVAFKKSFNLIKHTNKKYIFPVFYVFSFLWAIGHKVGKLVKCAKINKLKLFFYEADKRLG